MRQSNLIVSRAALAFATAFGSGAALAGSDFDSMADGAPGWAVSRPLFTVGESFDGYFPPGVLDGLGAYLLDEDTVRVFANHELLNFRGYEYQVSDGMGGTFGLLGARVSYFDIDIETLQVVGSNLAYDTIYDANGDVAMDAGFLSNDFAGLSRLCSSGLFEAGEFSDDNGGDEENRGLEDRIYFTGEEDGGFFNSVGGSEWALDPATGDFWQLPALGRGAWENVTTVDTGLTDYVAIILSDDSSPFDFNPEAEDGDEAAPLYLYVGQKDAEGDFPARNGLRGGKLYVWVSDTGETTPLDFNTAGTLSGTFVEVDNAPTGTPSEDGSTGFDEYGYPTQGNLWLQARALGSFGFSRPEDVATNPENGAQVVMASTGVDTYAVDEKSGNGADTFGTMYLIDIDFTDIDAPTGDLTILYDGDADPARTLRSPDNLDWADDGLIYVQEDEAEEDTLSGDEVLWGDGAANPNEAGVVRMTSNPDDLQLLRVMNIDRSVILDASIATPTDAFDTDAGSAGEWESSGILDVSELFDREEGTLFLFNVQAHGIEDQNKKNPDSRIFDEDLVEGGQLLFLTPCDANLDGDAMVGASDLAILLAAWGPCEECPADLDGDGMVGPEDIAELLAAWGSCFSDDDEG